MLRQLTVQNFGLIDRISLEFTEGLNILTGETGAGKSILIDALRIGLGERFSPSMIRDPHQPCVIEAVFELSSQKISQLSIFEDFLSDEEPLLIIRRSTHNNHKNKIKINGLSVTMTQLKAISRHLIDFHGAHDHQMLLSPESHKAMLDRLIDFEDLMNHYQKIYQDYTRMKNQYQHIQNLSSARDRELDVLNYQLKELQQVSLQESHYEELLQEHTKLHNIEKLRELLDHLLYLMETNNGGVSESIRQAFAPMRQLNQIDERTRPFLDMLTQLQNTHEQLLMEIHAYVENISFDPQEADRINGLWEAYEMIKKKYGPTITDAKNFYDQAKEKYDTLLHLDHKNTELKKQITELEQKLRKIAKQITTKRKKASAKLKITIEHELRELGIPHVQFESRITPNCLTQDGQDKVAFYISPNPGEDLKPLAHVVSSGEAARVMLALKKALIHVDPIPTLLFDEIDAQIGGRLGTITGKKLKDIAQSRQVILITHLPQIACFAQTHFKLLKTMKKNRALTVVKPLVSKQERLAEIAQMMSGEQQTEISLKHAKDMMNRATRSRKVTKSQ